MEINSALPFINQAGKSWLCPFHFQMTKVRSDNSSSLSSAQSNHSSALQLYNSPYHVPINRFNSQFSISLPHHTIPFLARKSVINHLSKLLTSIFLLSFCSSTNFLFSCFPFWLISHLFLISPTILHNSVAHIRHSGNSAQCLCLILHLLARQPTP